MKNIADIWLESIPASKTTPPVIGIRAFTCDNSHRTFYFLSYINGMDFLP